MTSRTSHLGAAVAPTLAGLSLAAGIAREAVDAVPIVKQVLGVVVRILALAEKIDKDREALHALAEKSAQLARRVKDVLGDEEPDAKILPSVERLVKAFQDVEEFMSKHVKRNRFIRGLSYAFTVNNHVDRLSRGMDNALQEIFAVALLAVNHQVRATHLTVEQDSQYDGEFRLIKHCQVDKLELFREKRTEEEDGNQMVLRYHSARVDGQILVVRYCERSKREDTHALPTTDSDETPYGLMVSCDVILKEVSTVQKSHPNVTRLYGWSKGSIDERFMVFKSGYLQVESLLDDLPNKMATGINWAFKLLDAVNHLKTLGVSWYPEGPTSSCFALNEHLEPMLGLQNDLRRINSPSDLEGVIDNQIISILWPIAMQTRVQDVATADFQAPFADYHSDQFTHLLGRLETLGRQRYLITKADFSSRRIFTDGTAEGLLRGLDENGLGGSWRVESWTWANILLSLDKARGSELKKGLKVIYSAYERGSDCIDVHGVDEDSDRVVYDRYSARIPDAYRTEIREMFGIPAPSGGKRNHLIAEGGPGTYQLRKADLVHIM